MTLIAQYVFAGHLMYEVLKELAGPAATIIAAFAALYVTAYFGRHQKRIAEERARVAKEKLRYDLFDRRLEIFSSVFAFYHAMISWEDAPEQNCSAGPVF
jgi:hypothetical protein